MLVYSLRDTHICSLVSFTLLVDYHSDIVETNNTYFEIFESIKFDIIFRRSPIISSSTHELAVLQEYSIHFTVLNIYFIRFVYTYLSFWSNSSVFLQNAWVVVYNSLNSIFRYLQTLSKYYEKCIFNYFWSISKICLIIIHRLFIFDLIDLSSLISILYDHDLSSLISILYDHDLSSLISISSQRYRWFDTKYLYSWIISIQKKLVVITQSYPIKDNTVIFHLDSFLSILIYK